MRGYGSLIRVNLKLALRERITIFFNYVFPLLLFFAFGQLMHADQGGAITQIVTMVLVIGVLGNGLFGGGIRAVQDREQNVLRRFKVAPISAAPMLVASIVTGWALYLPAAVATLALAHWIYGMAIPGRWLSLLLLVSVGVVAFRAIGLIIASVANSAQESQILVQLVYLPMLFLTGTTFSTTLLPRWAQVFSQFLPATYLVTGLQGILIRNESAWQNLAPIGVLALTTAISLFLSVQLFRWEKEEKLRASAKLYLMAMILPSLLLGGWHAYHRDHEVKARMLYREILRSRTLLIRGGRVFTGDGHILENGAVLVRRGRIAGIYAVSAPDPAALKAEPVEAAGKTILPGLIDVQVHVMAPGGQYDPPSAYKPDGAANRVLAAYLYCGVTAVRSVGDSLGMVRDARKRIESGQRLGAEVFASGPLFTADGGRGTEPFKDIPEITRARVQDEFIRTPATAEQARRDVDSLKGRGADSIQVVLDSGRAGSLVNRLDVAVLNAIAAEARARDLPLSVRVEDGRDLSDALAAGAASIDLRSFHGSIPDDLLARMARQHVFYNPGLSPIEAAVELASNNAEELDRSLVQQVGPPELLRGTRKLFTASPGTAPAAAPAAGLSRENLVRAWRAGVPLVTGTDAGAPLVIHGPTVQREIELWVRAGIPARTALEAATANGARLLGAGDRIGTIASGREANLLVVDGNPFEDISALERVSMVVFKGERLDRAALFGQ